jgi:hypothetical protein
MAARSKLKLLGSAVLTLGIATVSLGPESASANVVFDFNGTCNILGCPNPTSTATGVLTLTNAYVFGTDITSADFVSFSYSGAPVSFDITSGDSPFLMGGLNSDGSFNGPTGIQIISVEQFQSNLTQWGVEAGRLAEAGTISTFTNVTTAVPAEPSTWAMLVAGFAGLGFLGYRKTCSDSALA